MKFDESLEKKILRDIDDHTDVHEAMLADPFSHREENEPNTGHLAPVIDEDSLFKTIHDFPDEEAYKDYKAKQKQKEEEAKKAAAPKFKDVLKSKIIEDHEVKEQTPNEFFREMEEFFSTDIAKYHRDTLLEYRDFINALAEVFNQYVKFALDKLPTEITDATAIEWLSKIEKIIHSSEMGKLSKDFPKLPVKKFIIFREVRKKVNKSGFNFMNNNIKAVAEMIDYRTLKQLESLE